MGPAPKVVMVGNFGLRRKGTMAARALPLARALAQRGYELALLLPPWDSPEDSGRVTWQNGIKVVHMTLPRKPFQPLALSLRLLQAALAEHPAVVHAFKPVSYAGAVMMGLWTLRLLGRVHMRLVIDSDDWEGAGGWSDVLPLTGWQRALARWQERWCLRHADALTLASRELQTITESLGVPSQRTFYVPNGSGGPLASATRSGNHRSTEHSRLLLYTRFLEFEPRWVVEALRLIFASESNVRLVVAGEGFGDEGARFRQLLAEAGLAERVAFLGWVEPERLGEQFAFADVGLYPMDDTLINRTKCPAKLVELLAAGVPMVASAVGEVTGYISDGQTGMLSPPGDAQAFADAAMRLLSDREARQRIGMQAAEQMRLEFAWDRLAERVEAAYGFAKA